jgi:hypothetical protein
MARFRDYLKEAEEDDDLGRRREPLHLDGEGQKSTFDIEFHEKELERIAGRMYHAKEAGNMVQYKKFKKDYDASAKKLEIEKKRQKQGTDQRDFQFSNTISKFIATPGQSGRSEYTGQ